VLPHSTSLTLWSSGSRCSPSPARVTGGANRRISERWSPLYLRRHESLARIAAGVGMSAGTAHAYVTAVTGLLADLAPGLLKTLRESDPDFVLVDGALTECDRVGDSRADYSAKHRRHRVNVQVVTSPRPGPRSNVPWHG
jgi:hypothetical protein